MKGTELRVVVQELSGPFHNLLAKAYHTLQIGRERNLVMLTTLRIKNLALAADVTLELPAGYLAITGETGAGKSILIGALKLVLGERADRSLLRSGAEQCTVEAVFDVSRSPKAIQGCLEERGLEMGEDAQLVLKRSFTPSGTNRQFVNGSPVTLGILEELGNLLVDIHGPHDHQTLLDSSQQLRILDAYGGLDTAAEEFATLVRSLRVVEQKKADLILDERTYAQQLELLRHQVREISEARLTEEEEESLANEHRRCSNAARLLEMSQSSLELIGGDNASLLNQLGLLGRQLHELQRLDPASGSFADLQDQAVGLVKELQSSVSKYADRIDLDPSRLQEMEERLGVIQGLKRKYGPTVANVLQFGEQARSRLGELESREQALARLDLEKARIQTRLVAMGTKLGASRRAVAPRLEGSVKKHLAELGFRQSSFSVSIESSGDPLANAANLRESGWDRVEFVFAPNPGEPAKPLRAIASSGELARVMLALKTVLATQDRVPVLIFDEVDANVGGETGNAVGSKMRQIGEQRQVICITHLPVVAAAASAHFLVEKETREGRTTCSMRALTPKERVTELARMLGGQSEAARQHATALLRQ